MPKISALQRQANRNTIVAVAHSLFSQHGYSRVSVNEIIKSAGISKGQFYTYFESKQDIFFAIVEGSDSRKAHLSETISEDLPPKKRLEEYLRQRLQHFLNEESLQWVKFSSEFWATVELNEPIKQRHQQRYQTFSEDIATIIRAGIQTGHFRSDLDIDNDLPNYIYTLIATIDGIASLAAVMQQPVDPAKIDMAVDVLISYLMPTERLVHP